MPPSFVDLCHFAWGVPVVATLAGQGGAKLVTVARRLSIAQETARRTIRGLIDIDLVMPNPGYGHPMRPEYLLSPWGECVGPEALELWDVIQGLPCEAQAACRRKWTLPTLVGLASGADRFRDLEESLAGVSPRALAQSLESLVEAGLVVRRVDEGPPVRPLYLLREGAQALAVAAGSLADAFGAEIEGR